MKRRQFLKASITAGSAPLILSACTDNKNSDANGSSSISGFIFSDAHIGWDHEMQPTLETQAKMIKRIKKFFPHLDLVFDTGDVHHAHIKEPGRKIARNFWLSKMVGEFPRSLIHYIPGNHELGVGLKDAEITAAELGSMNFRPYYSFDYKGIHFISLPQLVSTILISRESLNWLKQDLLINRDKTVLIFSHNCLKETTYTNNETGYREVVNSDEVYKIINEYNNVIGWFHGHNHQYEIVKKHDRLYVSNGRIGGFNPPKRWGDFGQGHLGGIYFEINHIGLTVKSFSATENCFLEDLGFSHLSKQLQVSTSFQPNGKTNYYWGHGKMLNEINYQFHNHYLSNDIPYAVITPNTDTVINENNNLTYETDFFFAGSDINKIVGFVVRPGALKSSDTKQGLMIETLGRKTFQINFPEENYLYDTYLSRSGYYRCTRNCSYQLSANFSNLDEKTTIKYKFKVLDIKHQLCYQQSSFEPLKIIANQYQATIKIPQDLTHQPIDNRLYLFITIEVANPLEKIYVKNINLTQIVKPPQAGQELLFINEQQLSLSGNRVIIKIKELSSPSGSISIHDQNVSHTFLAVSPNIKWQVRNATAQMINDDIHIHALRHQFQDIPEIILTPTTPKSNFINRLKNIASCVISHHENIIKLTQIKNNDNAKIIFFTNSPNLEISGGTQEKQTDDGAIIISIKKQVHEVTIKYFV